MDIQGLIQDEIGKMADSGEIEAEIRKKARQVITQSINEAFRSYGKISKQIEASVGDALNLDLGKIDLDSYNHTITQMVKRIALEHLEDKAKIVITKRLEDLLSPAPKSITVQGLVDKCIEVWKDNGCLCSDSCHIQIDHHEWSEKSTSIKIWKEEPSGLSLSKMSPDVDIYVSDATILLPRLNKMTWPETGAFDMEAYVYQMFVSQTQLTDAHDVQDYDISTSYHDY